MKIITKLIFIFFISIELSCVTPKTLKGKVYESTNQFETIKLTFLNDSICFVEQIYHCPEIEDSLQHISIKSKFDVVKHKVEYSRTKYASVKLLVLENTDKNSKSLPKVSYIPNYEKLCFPKVSVNSEEYKIREKLKPGGILNLQNDSLLIKEKTIFFGGQKLILKQNKKASR